MQKKIEDLTFDELMDEYIKIISNAWTSGYFNRRDNGLVSVVINMRDVGEDPQRVFALTPEDQEDVLNDVKKAWRDEQQDKTPYTTDEDEFIRDVVWDRLYGYRTNRY